MSEVEVQLSKPLLVQPSSPHQTLRNPLEEVLDDSLAVKFGTRVKYLEVELGIGVECLEVDLGTGIGHRIQAEKLMIKIDFVDLRANFMGLREDFMDLGAGFVGLKMGFGDSGMNLMDLKMNFVGLGMDFANDATDQINQFLAWFASISPSIGVLLRHPYTKVVFKNIEPTKNELSKLQIPQKDVIQHEHSVDSDDDFQDPPPRKINEHSKKKRKVDSSTPVAKKPLRKKQVDIFYEHAQMRIPAPRAAKADGMKTPVFKPIRTRQASSSKIKKGKQTARVIFPQVHSKPDIHVEEVAVSKPDSHVEKEAFISKKFRDEEQVVVIEADKPNVDEGGLEQSGQHFSPDVVQSSDNISDGTKQQHADKDPDLQNMDYVGTERSPQRLSSEVDQELEATLLGKKGCTDLHSKKMNVEIDSQQLIPDELLRSINLDYLHSEKVVQHDCRHIDVCLYYLRKKSKYGPYSSYKNEPNKSYKYSTVDCNFMNIIRSLNDAYSIDHQNLKDGGQEHHLIEYINGFRIHAAVPWHTVEDIFISVNIKEKHHWVLVVLSFSERCIFLFDSYESSSHCAIVLAEIEKIAKIISLCLQAFDFYVKKGIDLQNHPRYKDKESLDMFDVLFEDDLPQQPSESLDCGVFMVMYAEYLSYGHKVIATEFDPNALRTRYAALLWDYGIRK
ncbi:hypothetical protein CQW23_12081 [Capsicum baccatum]|uniref:Ubiquitin-like protease family profile domain-containing protein n=1 Tax=Capsicum baccatum TaxID=33114 RepID=A0A2G2WRK8_CAPBA|nr:hypothetical protein CQW23_12081 [Capsicum baccatum]